MKYPYIVNKDGIWYDAGEEVPEDVVNEISYTKTEIQRMTTSELQALAYQNGIENAYEMTGSELKKILIDYFELQGLITWENQQD